MNAPIDLYHQLGNTTAFQLGSQLFSAESRLLSKVLDTHPGQFVLQMGFQEHINWWREIPHTKRVTIFDRSHPDPQVALCAKFDELPFLPDSFDIVFLPHFLEYITQPQQVLCEIQRVLKPTGKLIILGFNPASLWGIKHAFCLLTRQRARMPWALPFHNRRVIAHWLATAELNLMAHYGVFYRPPFTSCLEQTSALETLGRFCWPEWGASYLLLVTKHVIPLTAAKVCWQKKHIVTTSLEPVAHHRQEYLQYE